MIAHWDIVQGTEEWHKIRYGKIGGTLAKSILVEGDTLIKNVGSCYLEPFELEVDGYESFDMIRGTELEPIARRELSAYTGFDFLECGWLQSEECELMGISPDGITKSLTVGAEIKCPAKEKHTETLFNGVIPDGNIYQCLQLFAVNPLFEVVYFASFRPESQYPLFVRKITLNDIITLTVNRKKEVGTVQSFVERMRVSSTVIHATIKSKIKSLEF